MEKNMYEINETPAAVPASNGWKPWAAGGALMAVMLGGGGLYMHTSNVEAELKQLRTANAAEMSAIRAATESQAVAHQQTVASMNEQLTQAQNSARSFAASQARVNADRVAKRTAEMVQGLSAIQQEESARVAAALGEIKSTSETSFAQVNGKVGEVETEVGTVKTELGNTKSALDATIADLKSVRGDMGVQSGLIATNSTELAALRELGDRNYYEFSLTKQAPTTTLAGVNMKLRKADAKRNKFNLDLISDDKRVEKKDKNLHEPVQFYVGGLRQPFEIVVTSVAKDKISGYLATPKVMSARR